MARRTYASVPRFDQLRQPVDFVGGYNDFVNRTTSKLIEQATPSVLDIASQAGAQAGAYSALSIITDVKSFTSSGKSIGYFVQGLQLSYGQGLANIGGKYVVTNEAGRGGSTSAAKAILSSYNKYKSASKKK